MSLEVDDAGIGPVTTGRNRRKRDGGGGGDQRPPTRPRKVESVGIPVVVSEHDDGDCGSGSGGGADGLVLVPAIAGSDYYPPPPAGKDDSADHRTLEAPAATTTGGRCLTSTGGGEEGEEEGAVASSLRLESLPTDVISSVLEFADASSLLPLSLCSRRFEKLVYSPGTRMYLRVHFGTMPTSDDPAIGALIGFLGRIDARGVTWSPAGRTAFDPRGGAATMMHEGARWRIVSLWSPSYGSSGGGHHPVPTLWKRWFTSATLPPLGLGRAWREILSSPNCPGMKIFVVVGDGGGRAGAAAAGKSAVPDGPDAGNAGPLITDRL